MSFLRQGRSDLVIGMTLAEVFLLLLFVVWWGAAIESEPGGVDPTVTIANLQAQVKELNAKISSLQGEVAGLKESLREKENTIKALQIMLNCVDGTVDDCRRGLDGINTDARRGSPRCEQDNVLVNVFVHAGATRVELVGGSNETLSQLRRADGPVSKGSMLSERRDIEALLSSVTAYYTSRSQDECRFDYRLSYATAEDYYQGRQLFERYFYPAGIVQEQR